MLGIVRAEFVAWAKAYDGSRFHAVLSDPPYGLKFMGKDWDRVSAKEWGEAMLPLLYPGAIVFMFGGTRTWHKLATGMEEAGFEIWDTLMWLHGQGFPKAQDVSKLIDKEGGFNRNIAKHRRADREGYRIETQGTPSLPPTETSSPWQGHKTAALKPAWEPILCFRAPRQGKNYAELAMEHGSGALNVDGGRVGEELISTHGYPGEDLMGAAKGNPVSGKPDYHIAKGRYPANLALECTCEQTEVVDVADGTAVGLGASSIYGSRPMKKGGGKDYKGGKAIRHTDPNCPAYLLDEQAGRDKGQQAGVSGNQKSRTGESGIYGHYDAKSFPPPRDGLGGPSRFFYCAKASRSERGKANKHPTVKPTALTKWLATLLLPPDSVKPRRLLVPFAGSGSEMVGAIQAGWDEVVGIEQSEQYAEINSDLAVQRPLIAPAEAWRE